MTQSDNQPCRACDAIAAALHDIVAAICERECCPPDRKPPSTGKTARAADAESELIWIVRGTREFAVREAAEGKKPTVYRLIDGKPVEGWWFSLKPMK